MKLVHHKLNWILLYVKITDNVDVKNVQKLFVGSVKISYTKQWKLESFPTSEGDFFL